MIASTARNSKFSALSKFYIITDVGDRWQNSFAIEGTIYTAAALQHNSNICKKKQKYKRLLTWILCICWFHSTPFLFSSVMPCTLVSSSVPLRTVTARVVLNYGRSLTLIYMTLLSYRHTRAMETNGNINKYSRSHDLGAPHSRSYTIKTHASILRRLEEKTALGSWFEPQCV
jgi:hypothetical protein